MSMQELLQAFGMFKQSVQEAATTSAINDATKTMDQIKAGVTNEAEQRQALQNLSSQLALRLTGIGAPASTVQNAFTAIGPKQFGSVEQMQLEGAMTGNKLYQDTAKTIIGQREAQKKDLLAFQDKLETAREDKRFQRDIMLARLKALKSGPDLKPEELAFHTNVSVANKLLNELEGTVNDAGTYETRFGNKANSAKLSQIPYQLGIVYAKLVDPNSAARDSEVEAAMKYLFPMGVTANKDVALESIQHARDVIQNYAQGRAETQKAYGLPTPAYDMSQQNNLVTVPMKDGSIKKGYLLPNGDLQVVE